MNRIDATTTNPRKIVEVSVPSRAIPSNAYLKYSTGVFPFLKTDDIVSKLYFPFSSQTRARTQPECINDCNINANPIPASPR